MPYPGRGGYACCMASHRRYDSRMVKEAQADRVDDGEKLELLMLPGMVLFVVCYECRHRAELGLQYVRRKIGLQTTVGRLRRHLRCKKCAAHKAVVMAYRMPR
jgi:hypothetical protein